MPNGIKLLTGNSNRKLAGEVAEYLGIPVCDTLITTFSDGEIMVQINENVRGYDIFVLQSTCTPVNDNIVELLLLLDALKRASAGRITAVIPYYGYARTDKKDQPRVPITARLVADLLTVAGAKLDAPLAIMEKRRLGNADKTQTLNVIGDVDGCIALTVDDEIDTAGTLV